MKKIASQVFWAFICGYVISIIGLFTGITFLLVGNYAFHFMCGAPGCVDLTGFSLLLIFITMVGINVLSFLIVPRWGTLSSIGTAVLVIGYLQGSSLIHAFYQWTHPFVNMLLSV